jgi:hypothetical protein
LATLCQPDGLLMTKKSVVCVSTVGKTTRAARIDRVQLRGSRLL